MEVLSFIKQSNFSQYDYIIWGSSIVALLIIVFLSYFFLDNFFKNRRVTVKQITDAEFKDFEDTATDQFTIKTEEEISEIKPNIVDDILITVDELLNNAVIYDGYGNTDETLQLLDEAVLKEKGPKKKARLNIIYKEYLLQAKSLKEIIAEYPEIIDEEPQFLETETNDDEDLIDKAMEQYSLEMEKKLEEGIKTIDNFDNIPVLHDIITVNDLLDDKHLNPPTVAPIIEETSEPDAETLMKTIYESSEALDQEIKSQDENDTKNFFAEFGNLASQIDLENKQNLNQSNKKLDDFEEKTKESSAKTEVNQYFDVWVNYMSLIGGRMNLKNTFIHLDNPWGTLLSISEVQNKIDLDVGKDHLGEQIPWAMISVLPIHDNIK